MESIYILLTKSDTYISKMISVATDAKYTHASISFHKDLCPMYSFARKYLYTPLPAGIRTEPLEDGFFKRNDDIPCALYELRVSRDSYQRAQTLVQEMMANDDTYKFNILGLFLCKVNVSFKRKRYYFCSEFVSEILLESKALTELPKTPNLMRPEDYTNLKQLTCLYTGTIHSLANVYL